MNFDPNNNIVKLCADGMALEGEGKLREALKLFEQAWKEASNDFEKFTAAHYVARQQPTVADKLKWDELSLSFALKLPVNDVGGALPSLYLNIGKGYEDLNDAAKAKENYELALSFESYLLNDGYGNMIRGGIRNGMERVEKMS